jgi:hypothetical protein
VQAAKSASRFPESGCLLRKSASFSSPSRMRTRRCRLFCAVGRHGPAPSLAGGTSGTGARFVGRRGICSRKEYYTSCSRVDITNGFFHRCR